MDQHQSGTEPNGNGKQSDHAPSRSVQRTAATAPQHSSADARLTALERQQLWFNLQMKKRQAPERVAYADAQRRLQRERTIARWDPNAQAFNAPSLNNNNNSTIGEDGEAASATRQQQQKRAQNPVTALLNAKASKVIHLSDLLVFDKTSGAIAGVVSDQRGQLARSSSRQKERSAAAVPPKSSKSIVAPRGGDRPPRKRPTAVKAAVLAAREVWLAQLEELVGAAVDGIVGETASVRGRTPRLGKAKHNTDRRTGSALVASPDGVPSTPAIGGAPSHRSSPQSFPLGTVSDRKTYSTHGPTSYTSSSPIAQPARPPTTQQGGGFNLFSHGLGIEGSDDSSESSSFASSSDDSSSFSSEDSDGSTDMTDSDGRREGEDTVNSVLPSKGQSSSPAAVPAAVCHPKQRQQQQQPLRVESAAPPTRYAYSGGAGRLDLFGSGMGLLGIGDESDDSASSSEDESTTDDSGTSSSCSSDASDASESDESSDSEEVTAAESLKTSSCGSSSSHVEGGGDACPSLNQPSKCIDPPATPLTSQAAPSSSTPANSAAPIPTPSPTITRADAPQSDPIPPRRVVLRRKHCESAAAALRASIASLEELYGRIGEAKAKASASRAALEAKKKVSRGHAVATGASAKEVSDALVVEEVPPPRRNKVLVVSTSPAAQPLPSAALPALSKAPLITPAVPPPPPPLPAPSPPRSSEPRLPKFTPEERELFRLVAMLRRQTRDVRERLIPSVSAERKGVDATVLPTPAPHGPQPSKRPSPTAVVADASPELGSDVAASSSSVRRGGVAALVSVLDPRHSDGAGEGEGVWDDGAPARIALASAQSFCNFFPPLTKYGVGRHPIVVDWRTPHRFPKMVEKADVQRLCEEADAAANAERYRARALEGQPTDSAASDGSLASFGFVDRGPCGELLSSSPAPPKASVHSHGRGNGRGRVRGGARGAATHPARGGGGGAQPSLHKTDCPHVVTSQQHQQQHQTFSREYVTNVMTDALDDAAHTLVETLREAQQRLKEKTPLLFKARKRYVCGLREVLVAISSGACRCVLMAPDVERVDGESDANMQTLNAFLQLHGSEGHSAAEGAAVSNVAIAKNVQGEVATPADVEAAAMANLRKTVRQLGLEGSLRTIIAACRVKGIPVVYCLSRARMAHSIRQRDVRVSCVALLSVNGANDVFKVMLREAARCRNAYDAIVRTCTCGDLSCGGAAVEGSTEVPDVA